jgi:dCTP deaminase
MTLLSRPEILAEMEKGNILISPFDQENLGPNSYDVTFGPHIWRERFSEHRGDWNDMVRLSHAGIGNAVYNPYNKKEVEELFDKEEAIPAHKRFDKKELAKLVNIDPEDLIVLIAPGESILGHTIEFIGGCSNNITTKMFARSSIGRNFLEVCRCAGMGDIGYCTRWTMEITNNSQWYTIPLVVGRRLAQIEFVRTTPVQDKYTKRGKYQTEANPLKLADGWTPEMMLPKLYLDREI